MKELVANYDAQLEIYGLEGRYSGSKTFPIENVLDEAVEAMAKSLFAFTKLAYHSAGEHFLMVHICYRTDFITTPPEIVYIIFDGTKASAALRFMTDDGIQLRRFNTLSCQDYTDLLKQLVADGLGRITKQNKEHTHEDNN